MSTRYEQPISARALPLSPRILGHTVGLHPILSVFALLVGIALCGLLGAFFACPAAGIIQTFVRSRQLRQCERHPDQFPAAEAEPRADLAPAFSSGGQEKSWIAFK